MENSSPRSSEIGMTNFSTRPACRQAGADQPLAGVRYLLKGQSLKAKRTVLEENMRPMKKVLIINTSDSRETIVGLKIDGQEYFLKGKSKILKAQNVLPLIEKILKKQNLQLNDLTAIKVNTGPGSFTGLRVGVAVANALAWVLKIPVNGKKLAEPKY